MIRYHLPFRPSRLYYGDSVIEGDDCIATILAVQDALQRVARPESPFVLLYAPNHPKTIAAYLAILNAGKSCVLADPDIGAFELEEMLAITPPGALITPRVESNHWDFASEIHRAQTPPPSELAPIEPSSTLVYTAAEDGYAKPAVLSLQNMIADTHAHIISNGSTPASAYCAVIPYHHLFGLVTGALSPCLANAACVVIEPSNMRAFRKALSLLARARVSHLYSVPVVYYVMSKIPEAQDVLSQIPYITSGGYALSEHLYATYATKFNAAIREGYGLTEASPICAWNHPDREVKCGSVGQSFSCCTIRCVDDAGKEVRTGMPGEIIVRGENVMNGYYGFAEATKKAIRKGWLHTGDYGSFDSNGYLYIRGLKKDMANIRGLKAYPAELQRYIKRNPSVESVHIFTRKSDLEGDKLYAEITFDRASENAVTDLVRWCKGKLTPFKCPHFQLAQ
jgi:long-chain acyl-CoA synthetase